MANNEFAVENAQRGLTWFPLNRLSGIRGPDDGAAILHHDFQFNVSEQAAIPAGAKLDS